ncbi:MAG TPA: prenyltransferase/squalene oxidase repeat-containing protein [Pirellulales bacterium]|jgi:squalene-hopene/tetraprenyl-beta-curcumene cyclase|nr:prenyltransferase/squalene oxidase repeat-containing protein [Pirellulales bacterium]
MLDHQRLLNAYQTARHDLLAERNVQGHWQGELSSSALSTATALSALVLMNGALSPGLVESGVRWLIDAQNADGGWGDTDKSRSNIATSMLVQAALRITGSAEAHPQLMQRAADYVEQRGGIGALRRRYGNDKTFAVPILTNAALAGMVPWSEVAALPFELACLPQSWYRLVRLPVVSYAIPALVAIGQARFVHEPPKNAVIRAVRRAAVERSLRVLHAMQPASGGYLEATPLTSFVVMSLASIGRADHPVARQGTEFLLASVRPDGSWPIDTNLATWVTTLATKALAPTGVASLDESWAAPEMIEWLLACQHVERHPFTGAEPGGWAWSDLSGAVPDADDTAGALLALAELLRRHDDAEEPTAERVARFSAIEAGQRWLLGLQNRDGGWPTFCRGWGKLPFDRSGDDLTAHALCALHAWRLATLAPGDSPGAKVHGDAANVDRAIDRGLRFLARRQRRDGSWVPLWFGNQYDPAEENPVYGTAQVLKAYGDLGLMSRRPARRGVAWLVANQNADGGWGGAPVPRFGNGYNRASSVEETAWAVEALAGDTTGLPTEPARERGVQWLIECVEQSQHWESSPVGFYFAKLWYYERLYPLIFTVSALGRAVRRSATSPEARPAAAGQHPS